MKNISFFKYCIVLTVVLTAWGCGDDLPIAEESFNKKELTDSTTDKKIDPGVFSGSALPLSSGDECCLSPGAADECWDMDAIADGVTCENDSDCASGQTCDTTMSGVGYSGICSCSSHDDCNDGVCHEDTNRCGPSWCNGYYICSCFGGCVWWDGNSNTNTPADDAARLTPPRTCCEGDYPAGNISNKYFSLDPDCGFDSSIITGCESDADCDDLNDCTANTCNLTTGVCSTLVMVGQECEADGLGCTIDRCNAAGECVYSALRCPPDTYGTEGDLNTCTIDCEEDPFDSTGNGEHWTCYVDVNEPLDTAVKDVTGSCEYWTCDTSSSPYIPVLITQAQSDAACLVLDNDCNSYACDPADSSKDNCSAITMNLSSPCTPGDPLNLCIEGVCEDGGSGEAQCVDYDILPPVVDDDPCNVLVCETSTGAWGFVPDAVAIAASAPCNDGDLCTTDDICIAGGFCAGTPVECTDDQCTEYGCNPATGTCVAQVFYNASVSCDLGDGLWCTYGTCNGVGGCSLNNVVCGGIAPECNMMACMEDIDACEYIANPATIGNECFGITTAPNCEATCEEIPHFNATLAAMGEMVGECQASVAVNDDCSSAWDLGGFLLADPGGATIGEFGSTACATNRHYSTGTNCMDGPVQMGRFSPDVVYSFTYEATGSGSARTRYLVKVEPEPGFDAGVYVSTGCTITGEVSAVSSNACVINSALGIQEDQCMNPYDCTPVDGSYTGAMASAIVYEEPTATAGQMITVYIYIDGSTNISPLMNSGEFFVSVTKEDACPDPATWYGGKINTVIEPGVNDLPVPINGVDFPGVVPPVQTGTLGNMPAVLLLGDTRSEGNHYTGELADDPYAFAGFDEMWQLDILADGVTFGVSMCDYGGSVNQTGTPAFNPMVALFNCHGDRVDQGDGSVRCGASIPHIQPTVPVVAEDGPYYLLVDGRFETGVTGNTFGHEYEVSIFYEGLQPTVACEPDSSDPTAPKYGVSLPLVGPPADELIGDFYYYPSSCVSGDASSWNHDYIRITANDVVPVGTYAQCCDWNWNSTDGYVRPWGCTNTAPCFPLTFIYDIWYENSGTGQLCLNSGTEYQYDRHGNNVSGHIPTATPYEGCDTLTNVSLSYLPPAGLTEDEYNWCTAHCPYTTILYLRRP